MPKQSAQHEAPRASMRSHQPDTAVKILVLGYESFSALQMEHMHEKRLLDTESHLSFFDIDVLHHLISGLSRSIGPEIFTLGLDKYLGAYHSLMHVGWQFQIVFPSALVTRYAAWPDQWKSRQASKQNAYKEFVDVFGSETKSQKKNIPAIQHTHPPAGKNNVKLMRKEIEQCLQNSNPLQSSLLNTPGHEISLSKLGFPASKRQRKEGFACGTAAPADQESKKFTQNGKAKVNKREKKKKIPLGMSIETSLSKVMMNTGSHSKRRLRDDNSSLSSLKKHKK